MSKLKCQCGHTIYDQTDFLPYKAWFYKDQDVEEVYETLVNEIDSFLTSIIEGKRKEWVKSKFGKGYPLNLNNKSVINDLFIRNQNKKEYVMYQCEECGRLKVETDEENIFESFVPEFKDQNKKILKGWSE